MYNEKMKGAVGMLSAAFCYDTKRIKKIEVWFEFSNHILGFEKIVEKMQIIC